MAVATTATPSKPQEPPSDRAVEQRRLHQLAELALDSWRLGAPRLTLLEHKTNVTFRVDVDEPGPGAGRYLLRLCHLGAYRPHEIRAEMIWLSHLASAGLIVPDPVATRDGDWVVRARVDGLEARCVVMTRWVPGEILEGDPNPADFEQVGELAGRIHRCAESFTPPDGFRRPRWDADRLFGPDSVVPPGRGEPIVTARTRAILDEAAAEMRRLFQRMGEAPEVFGLIHKDLEPDNTVVHQGQVHAIDFADCGWGYYLYDIAASLLPLRERQGYPELRRAFLRGYRRIRRLSREDEKLLDAFLIARSLFTIRFMVLESIDERPEVYAYAQTVIPLMVGEIRRFLEQGGLDGANNGGRPDNRAGQGAHSTTTVRLLADLRQRGIELWTEDGKLRFKAPRGALDAALKAELKARREEIIAFLLQSYAGQRAARAAVTGRASGDREPTEGPAPLSFAQKRLWFIDQLLPGSSEYNVSRAARLDGRLRIDRLERSLREVVERHAVLRTRFATVDSEPVQILDPPADVHLPVVDLGRLPVTQRMAEARSIVRRESHRPFDLGRGPLMRLTLLRLEPTVHVAASTLHHIISDGWSAAIFFRELGLLYAAFNEGRPSPLPQLTMQYADYARWQQDYLAGDLLEQQLEFWRSTLAGAPATLELPTDRPRPALPTAQGRAVPLQIPRSTVALLQRLVAGATPFMVLLTVFNLLLHRLSGQRDLVVGIPIANRTRTELEGLIGFFVNTLVLRTRLTAESSLRRLLDRARVTTVDAYAHQDLPFEKLVEELEPERDLRSNPLFQVMFTLQNAPRETLDLSGVTLSFLPTDRRTAMFDLSLTLEEQATVVTGSLEYRTELFDHTTVQRWGRALERLPAALVRQPDRPLGELPLLSPAETHQLIMEWNAPSGADAPPTSRAWGASCITSLFFEQASRTPEAPALAPYPHHADGTVTWTYGELAARVRRLARRFESLGVGPESRVGLAAERSPQTILAILAIWTAGGAYVPLDPSQPEERLRGLIADADLTALALPPDRQTLAALTKGLVTIDLSELAGEATKLHREPAAILDPVFAGPEAAYMIYTSGSTGKPKGVMVSQEAVASHALAVADRYGLGPTDRIPQLAPISFDLAIEEIFPHLISGATVFLPEDGLKVSFAELWDFLETAGITVLSLPTAFWHEWVEELERSRSAPPADLRLVVIGTEQARADRIAAWHRLPTLDGERPELINAYGPTEATITATTAVTRGLDDEISLEHVTIGRPLANSRVLVLDTSGRPAPIGVAGHLHLGGASLARGYHARPAVTALAFTPDAITGETGGRLYATGDRARLQADGQLQFLGRQDHQVKVRGFRVELGAIEATLNQLPEVAAAVVAVVDVGASNGSGRAEAGSQLVAWIVASETAIDLRPDDVFNQVSQRLPAYMVPSTVSILPALPLTPSGKIDRRALALSRPELATEGDEPQAPRTPTEEILTALWGDVLDCENVGIQDHFFASGGHSLMATQLISRIGQHFGIDLPLRRVFETPRLSDLAEAIDETLRQTQGIHQPPLTRVSRDGVLPLSFAQTRLWFLDELEPGSAAYNIPGAVRLVGTLEPAFLAAALAAVRRRHESLRTTFRAVQGQPQQIISPAASLPLPQIDLERLDEGSQQRMLDRLTREDALRPFDLAIGPLVRATLVQLADDEHVILLTLHHIVSDGWSMGIFLRDLVAFYRAFEAAAGSTEPALDTELPELAIQYPDHAVWQRACLTEERIAAEIEHWRGRLAGAPSSLDLPTDRPRPPVETSRGTSHSVHLAPSLATALESLARRQGVTPFMVLLGAFQAILAHWSGSDDIVVGSPIAGRSRRELEELIGVFVNNLVLRGDLAGAPTFLTLLQRTRETTLDAFAHQDLPFERLVEALEPKRDLSRSPIFQVMFILQNVPPSGFEIPGLQIEPLASDSATAKYDLTLSLEQSPGGIRGSLESNADLFDATTAARLVGHFERLVAHAIEQPERRVGELSWLGPAQQHQLTYEWNTLPRPSSFELGARRPSCLHELVAAQAARTPTAFALKAVTQGGAETPWTYRELTARSRILARRLVALGVGPEIRVGVCARRRPELVAALLAVLEAGGTYVPLDPAYPESRLAFMLEDADVRVLVGHGDLLAALPLGERPVLYLDGLGETALSETADAGLTALPEAPRATADQLAYTIYTSGSTGRPKGVAIEHRSAVALLAWARDLFDDVDLSGVLASTSINFDLSIFEIFLPLTTGGTAILVRDALDLPRVSDAGVRLLNTVPSAATELVRQAAIPSSVTTLNLAGEPLTRDLTDQLFAHTSVRRVLNLYGPSEDTTYSTFASIPRGSEKPMIGFPLAGTQAHILNRQGRMLGIGIPGELVLGGAGLARGYLGRPAGTAASFTPNPWGERPGERLYRTGDLVARRATGELDFLGRLDHQVKVRGFRIELGEIEAALLACAAVRDAVVVVREDAPGDPRLVAYVVTSESYAFEAGGLRQELDSSLPAYMVPSTFVTLAQLPLTPNGKVDRRALPEPGDDATAASQRIAPRNQAEDLLVSIWADVLRRHEIGVTDDFFELGGHSLLATQIVSRVREAFSVDLEVRTLFETPTVAALARAVDARRRGTADPSSPTLPTPAIRAHQAARAEPAPLSFAQSRLWFLEQLGVTGSAYHMPVAAELHGPLRAELLEQSLQEIARRHQVLRSRFEESAGEPYQVVLDEVGLSLPSIDLEALKPDLREAEARRLAEAIASRPFDLERGPLARAAVLRLTGERHLLILVVHHIASDGWSMSVLLDELTAFYRAFAAGHPSPLPELSIQYADFARWQRAWLSDDVLAAEIEHWRQRLEGAPASLELPVDRPYPAVQSFAGASYGFSLPAALSTELARWSRGRGTTLFMTLMAAFQSFLGRHAGQDDVVVGTPVAGRNRREIEGLIGFFINTLALRLNLASDATFSNLVHQTRDVVLDAFAHQDVPFEQLIEQLVPHRDLSRDPVFQVVFALQNMPRPTLELPELRVLPVDSATRTAKFDLTLFLEEAGDEASDGGLRGSFEYRTALFDATTIARLANRFGVFLTDAISHSDRRLSDLSVLSRAERHQIEREWNPCRDLTGEQTTVPQRIADWAERQAARPALVSSSGRISYRDLEARAGRLAAHLRSLGVGSHTRVGVCLERSPEEIIAFLAIWRAGGAYLPIDPSSPLERRRYMLRDAEVAVLITTTTIEDAIEGSSSRARRVNLDVDAWRTTSDPLSGEPSMPLIANPEPDQIAYVIYTSGSTGWPKGVEITHRALARLVDWHRHAFSIRAEDHAPHLAGLAFDASVWEIWPYLASGATVHLPDETQRKSPEALQQWLLEQSITVAFVPTPLAEILLTLPWPREAALRVLLTGGDVLRRSPSTELPFSLVNNYGPTENTVVATSGTVPFVRESGIHRAPSLGRPISGVGILLLDRQGRPVAIGVPGELTIEGDNLARGYLEQPQLTAKAFVPHPSAATPGERLYRTGDLARWRADGELDFLGRIDHQVKVRGLRIELGEIEAQLTALPQIRESVVLVREDLPGRAGDRALVAYAVGASADAGDEVALREALAKALPAAMVPTFFVFLEAWPLTGNGKIDRGRLPLPSSASRSAAAIVAPRDATELALVQIWEDLLGRSPISVDEDFFGLGGHSLLAVRLMTRIRERLGRELPLTTLFQGATIESLAMLLRDGAETAERQPLVVLRRVESHPPDSQPTDSGISAESPLFCIHPVGGNVLCYLDLVRRLGPGMAVYGLQAPRAEDFGRAKVDMEHFAEHYLREVRAVWPQGPYRLLGWSMGGLVAFEMARQLEAAGCTVERLVLLDTAPPAISSTDAHEPEDASELVEAFLHDLVGLSGRDLALPDHEFFETEGEPGLGDLERVTESLVELGLLPPELAPSQVSELFAMFATNVRALRRYRAAGTRYR
ncbi:MAG: amino acid adenylation domain-containing protein, partial [Acidobacteriota bacterium]